MRKGKIKTLLFALCIAIFAASAAWLFASAGRSAPPASVGGFADNGTTVIISDDPVPLSSGAEGDGWGTLLPTLSAAASGLACIALRPRKRRRFGGAFRRA